MWLSAAADIEAIDFIKDLVCPDRGERQYLGAGGHQVRVFPLS
jgi:hypothetical protein